MTFNALHWVCESKRPWVDRRRRERRGKKTPCPDKIIITPWLELISYCDYDDNFQEEWYPLFPCLFQYNDCDNNFKSDIHYSPAHFNIMTVMIISRVISIIHLHIWAHYPYLSGALCPNLASCSTDSTDTKHTAQKSIILALNTLHKSIILALHRKVSYQQL